jgi:DNA polymerase-4
MRKPIHAEVMYTDADGMFASCEQFMHPHLREKPVGIVPMITGSSCVIAVSREAKAMGVKNVMPIEEARRVCPGLIEWPQHPDLYRRAHNELLSEISMVVPIDTVKSIDELCCVLGANQVEDPLAVGLAIKARIKDVFGPWINMSMGYGPNRLLAKMACKAGKPAGNMVWSPRNLYQHLMAQELSDIPGIGNSMLARLEKAGIRSIEKLLDCSPSHMAALWGSVAGRRMYYALHGYDIHAEPSKRGQFGHSRMLPPTHRTLPLVRDLARLLMVKATRRMRREQFRASRVYFGVTVYTRDGRRGWFQYRDVPQVCDYTAILKAMGVLWDKARSDLNPRLALESVNVCLGEISPMSQRQLDMWEDDEGQRLKEEALSDAIDAMNQRYCSTVLYPGIRDDQASDNIGMKISYGRIPRIEDRV